MGSKVKGYRCKKCGRQVNVDYKKIKDRINPKCPACFEPIDMSWITKKAVVQKL